MKKKDLKAVNPDEVPAKVAELRKELIKHYGQRATGSSSKTPGQIRSAKRTIAQLLTLRGKKKHE